MSLNINWLYSAADEADTLHQEKQANQMSDTTADGGSVDANGWSLPPTFRATSESSAAAAAAASTHSGANHRPSVPIPVYCRPVTDDPSVQVILLCSDAF